MNVLITGATGFIGTHLTKELYKQGYHCRCLVRNKEKAKKIFSDYADIEYFVGDITKPETLNGIEKKIDIVFHLAALLGDSDNINKIYDVNVNGLINILRRFNKLNLFIFYSTPGVQGLGIEKATENMPYNPRGIYEKSKVYAEKALLKFSKKNGINWIILRPDFVYGPGDFRRIKLYKKISRKKMYIIGNGKNLISPTFIKDLTKISIELMLKERAYNEIYNISGAEITFKKYLSTIAEHFDIRLPKLRIPVFIALITNYYVKIFSKILNFSPIITKSRIDFITKFHSTNSDKLKSILNIDSYRSLDYGIKETIKWAKKEKLI